MELYQEMFASMLTNLSWEQAQTIAVKLCVDPTGILECRSYQALQNIKNILEDETLNDEECFLKIEEIVSQFEQLGSNCGERHDFG